MTEQKAYVSGGHVYCRLRREDLDVEVCFGCTRLRQLNDKSSPPYVVCDAKDMPEIGAGDPLFVEWWHAHRRRGR